MTMRVVVFIVFRIVKSIFLYFVLVYRFFFFFFSFALLRFLYDNVHYTECYKNKLSLTERLWKLNTENLV